MKRTVIILLFVFALVAVSSDAMSQCSICTKTAQQLGEKPAQGMNSGIIYLMLSPLAIIGYLSYRWIKSNR